MLPVLREAPGGALRLLLWFLTQSCSLRAPVGVRTGSAAHGAPLAPPRLGGAPAGLQIPLCSSGCSCSRQRLAELCRKQEFLPETHGRRREGKAAAAGAPRGRGQREGTRGGGTAPSSHVFTALLRAVLTVPSASGTARWAAAGAAWWQQGQGRGQARPLARGWAQRGSSAPSACSDLGFKFIWSCCRGRGGHPEGW